MKKILLAFLLFFQSFTFSHVSYGQVRQIEKAKLAVQSLQVQFLSMVRQGQLKTSDLTMALGTRLESSKLINEQLPSVIYEKLLPTYQAGKKGAGIAGSAIAKGFSHAALQFTPESIAFFIGLGALNVEKIIFADHTHPGVTAQHIDAQKDPITHLSFYMFMWANGSAAPLLSHILKPKNHTMIPYLGMSLGMTASHIVQGIFQLPGMRECAGVTRPEEKLSPDEYHKQRMEACDNAWKAFVHKDKKSMIFESLPDFTSMLLSSYVLHLASQGLLPKLETAMNEKAMLDLIRTMGGEAGIARGLKLLPKHQLVLAIAPIFLPGVREIGFVGRFLYKIGNIVTFTALDMAINAMVRTPSINAYKSSVMNDLEDELQASLLKTLQNNWSSKDMGRGGFEWKAPSSRDLMPQWFGRLKWQSAPRPLSEVLGKFSEKMKGYREFNIETEKMAEANWNYYLSELVSKYNFSKALYSHMSNEIRTSKAQKEQNIENPYSLLKLKNPLNGITPLDFTEDEEHKLLTFPAEILPRQKQKLTQVLASLPKLLQKSQLEPYLKTLPNSDKAYYERTLKALRSSDDSVVGKTLLEMANAPKTASAPLKRIFQLILNELGSPSPAFEPGQYYLSHFTKVDASKVYAKSLAYWKYDNQMRFENPAEAVIAKMVFGPLSPQETRLITSMESGGLAHFIPPSILAKRVSVPNIGSIETGKNRLRNIYQFPVEIGADQVRTPWQLVTEGPVQKEFIEDFDGWWKKNVDQYMEVAWKDYQYRYGKMIRNFRQKYFTVEKKLTNTSAVPNGILASVYQEMNVYFLVLGESMTPRKEIPADVVSALSEASILEKFALNYRQNGLQKMVSRVEDLNGSETRSNELIKMVQNLMFRYSQMAAGKMKSDDQDTAKLFENFGKATELFRQQIAQMNLIKERKDLAFQALDGISQVLGEMKTYSQISGAIDLQLVLNGEPPGECKIVKSANQSMSVCEKK